MISSTNFLNRICLFLFVAVLCFSGCAWTKKSVGKNAQTHEEKFLIAVLPFENLSGTNAPLKDMRALFMNTLRADGFRMIAEESLEKFMSKNRVRYTGGIDKPLALAFKKETEAEGVLITSLELYSEVSPPKIALTARLVSSGDEPAILWIDGMGLAGDDSPGILELGLIEDPKALFEKGVRRLADSLREYFDKKSGRDYIRSLKRKFRPKVSYRSDVFDPGQKYTVAVVPFLNLSERKNAGAILELEFIRSLKRFEQFDVVEPGTVRQQLLTMRMIIPEGISLANADALFAALNVDLILAADVNEYQDYQGVFGKAKVDFFVQLIEKKSRSVVWSSASHNEGDDGVFFFDRGRVNTAHAMASQMTRWIGEMMIAGSERVQGERDRGVK